MIKIDPSRASEERVTTARDLTPREEMERAQRVAQEWIKANTDWIDEKFNYGDNGGAGG